MNIHDPDTRRRISEATRAGLARARAEGKQIGRPRTMPAATLDRIQELRDEGCGYHVIATVLNAQGIPGSQGGRWHYRSVRRAVETYLDG